MLTDRVAIEPVILFETAHEIPPGVTNLLQKGSGGRPGIKEYLLRAAAWAITGIDEPLQG